MCWIKSSIICKTFRNKNVLTIFDSSTYKPNKNSMHMHDKTMRVGNPSIHRMTLTCYCVDMSSDLHDK